MSGRRRNITYLITLSPRTENVQINTSSNDKSRSSSNADLLTPREVANMFGVTTTTVSRWARLGRLRAIARTPGGHRRYLRADALSLLDEEGEGVDADREKIEEDAVRLYSQGWSIRQVAERFECSYGAMRKILLKRTSLGDRGEKSL
jgi:excisionase family DNA binding protein